MSQAMFDASVRIENLIWIPGAVADIEATPEVFDERFVDYLPKGRSALLYVQLPILSRFAGEYPDPVDVAQWLYNTPGFLVQAATPVKEYHSDSGCTFSWGRYRFAWLYAATEADIERVCIEWAEATDAADRAKTRASETSS